MPFDAYPGKGYKLSENLRGSNCRHGYGLELQKATHQTCCAYCNLSLVDTYEHWLLMSVDHVVPIQEGKQKGIPDEWLYDLSNTVLSCSGCNGFRNRFKFPQNIKLPKSFPEFCKMRDRFFLERKKIIEESRAKEKAFFNSKPWEK